MKNLIDKCVFLVEKEGDKEIEREYNGTNKGALYLRPDQAETLWERQKQIKASWGRSDQEICCETL